MTAGPTPSEETNRLLEQCSACERGETDVSIVRQALVDRAAVMRTAREEFMRLAEEAPEAEDASARQQALCGAQQAFDAYDQSLVRLGAALGTPAARPAMRAVSTATFNLFFAVNDFHERFGQPGRTRYRLLNQLLAALERGERPPQAVQQARQQLQAASDEMRGAGQNELAELFRQVMARIDESADMAPVDAARVIGGAYDRLNNALRAHQEKLFEAGPTASVAANTLHQGARLLADGRYGAAHFARDLEVMQREARDLRDYYEGMAEACRDSPVRASRAQEAIAALRSVEAALDEYRRYFTTPMNEHLERGNDMLVAAALEFERARAHLGGAIACPRCGAPNEAGQRACSQCSAILPRQYGSSSTFSMPEGGGALDTDQPVMTEGVKALAEATSAFESGAIAADEYARRLDEYEQKLVRVYEQVAATPALGEAALEQVPPDVRQSVKMAGELRGGFVEGVERMFAGVAALREYAASGERDRLFAGMRDVFEASQQMLRARVVGEKLLAKLPREVS
jgi:hypothetical protein